MCNKLDVGFSAMFGLSNGNPDQIYRTEVRLRFWTDDIAAKKGEIIPKHAWGSGMINIERNAAHGLTPTKWLAFNSVSEIPAVIEKCLIENGVKVIASRKMKKYSLAERPAKAAEA